MPQTLEAQTELRLISATKHNIMSAQAGKPQMKIVQDSLLGAYKMTKGLVSLRKDQFQNLSLKGVRPDGEMLHRDKKLKDIRYVQKRFRKDLKNKQLLHSGKGLFSLILPDDLIYEKKNNANPEEPTVKIYKGVMYEGTLDKSILGSSHNSLIQIIHKEYGKDWCANFIDNVQFLTNAFLLIHGFSVGLQDCLITSQERVAEIKHVIGKCYVEAKGVEETTYNPGIREIRVAAALSKAKDVGLRIAKDAMDPSNNLISTVKSGSKGDFFNIAQLTGLLGQQNLSGKRVQPTLNHGKRTLVHYPFGITDKKLEYESRGFISHSFIHGLNPKEFYFHAMSGREGICATAMGTAKSGYIQHRIVKVSEDIQVQYDGTVRDHTGKIYQFCSGENAYDPSRTVKVNGKDQVCDVGRLVNMLNMEVESKDIKEELKEEPKMASVDDLQADMEKLAVTKKKKAPKPVRKFVFRKRKRK